MQMTDTPQGMNIVLDVMSFIYDEDLSVNQQSDEQLLLSNIKKSKEILERFFRNNFPEENINRIKATHEREFYDIMRELYTDKIEDKNPSKSDILLIYTKLKTLKNKLAKDIVSISPYDKAVEGMLRVKNQMNFSALLLINPEGIEEGSPEYIQNIISVKNILDKYFKYCADSKIKSLDKVRKEFKNAWANFKESYNNVINSQDTELIIRLNKNFEPLVRQIVKRGTEVNPDDKYLNAIINGDLISMNNVTSQQFSKKSIFDEAKTAYEAVRAFDLQGDRSKVKEYRGLINKLKNKLDSFFKSKDHEEIESIKQKFSPRYKKFIMTTFTNSIQSDNYKGLSKASKGLIKIYNDLDSAVHAMFSNVQKDFAEEPQHLEGEDVVDKESTTALSDLVGKVNQLVTTVDPDFDTRKMYVIELKNALDNFFQTQTTALIESIKSKYVNDYQHYIEDTYKDIDNATEDLLDIIAEKLLRVANDIIGEIKDLDPTNEAVKLVYTDNDFFSTDMKELIASELYWNSYYSPKFFDVDVDDVNSEEQEVKELEQQKLEQQKQANEQEEQNKVHESVKTLSTGNKLIDTGAALGLMGAGGYAGYMVHKFRQPSKGFIEYDDYVDKRMLSIVKWYKEAHSALFQLNYFKTVDDLNMDKYKDAVARIKRLLDQFFRLPKVETIKPMMEEIEPRYKEIVTKYYPLLKSWHVDEIKKLHNVLFTFVKDLLDKLHEIPPFNQMNNFSTEMFAGPLLGVAARVGGKQVLGGIAKKVVTNPKVITGAKTTASNIGRIIGGIGEQVAVEAGTNAALNALNDKIKGKYKDEKMIMNPSAGDKPQMVAFSEDLNGDVSGRDIVSEYADDVVQDAESYIDSVAMRLGMPNKKYIDIDNIVKETLKNSTDPVSVKQASKLIMALSGISVVSKAIADADDNSLTLKRIKSEIESNKKLLDTYFQHDNKINSNVAKEYQEFIKEEYNEKISGNKLDDVKSINNKLHKITSSALKDFKNKTHESFSESPVGVNISTINVDQRVGKEQNFSEDIPHIDPLAAITKIYMPVMAINMFVNIGMRIMTGLKQNKLDVNQFKGMIVQSKLSLDKFFNSPGNKEIDQVKAKYRDEYTNFITTEFEEKIDSLFMSELKDLYKDLRNIGNRIAKDLNKVQPKFKTRHFSVDQGMEACVELGNELNNLNNFKLGGNDIGGYKRALMRAKKAFDKVFLNAPESVKNEYYPTYQKYIQVMWNGKTGTTKYEDLKSLSEGLETLARSVMHDMKQADKMDMFSTLLQQFSEQDIHDQLADLKKRIRTTLDLADVLFYKTSLVNPSYSVLLTKYRKKYEKYKAKSLSVLTSENKDAMAEFVGELAGFFDDMKSDVAQNSSKSSLFYFSEIMERRGILINFSVVESRNELQNTLRLIFKELPDEKDAPELHNKFRSLQKSHLNEPFGTYDPQAIMSKLTNLKEQQLSQANSEFRVLLREIRNYNNSSPSINQVVDQQVGKSTNPSGKNTYGDGHYKRDFRGQNDDSDLNKLERFFVSTGKALKVGIPLAGTALLAALNIKRLTSGNTNYGR